MVDKLKKRIFFAGMLFMVLFAACGGGGGGNNSGSVENSSYNAAGIWDIKASFSGEPFEFAPTISQDGNTFTFTEPYENSTLSGTISGDQYTFSADNYTIQGYIFTGVTCTFTLSSDNALNGTITATCQIISDFPTTIKFTGTKISAPLHNITGTWKNKGTLSGQSFEFTPTMIQDGNTFTDSTETISGIIDGAKYTFTADNYIVQGYVLSDVTGTFTLSSDTDLTGSITGICQDSSSSVTLNFTGIKTSTE